jgi:hypothetical protein
MGSEQLVKRTSADWRLRKRHQRAAASAEKPATDPGSDGCIHRDGRSSTDEKAGETVENAPLITPFRIV